MLWPSPQDSGWFFLESDAKLRDNCLFFFGAANDISSLQWCWTWQGMFQQGILHLGLKWLVRRMLLSLTSAHWFIFFKLSGITPSPVTAEASWDPSDISPRMKWLFHIIVPWIHRDSWQFSPSWRCGVFVGSLPVPFPPPFSMLGDSCTFHVHIPAPSHVPCRTSWKMRGRDFWEGVWVFFGKAVPIPTSLHSHFSRCGPLPCWHQNEHLIICRSLSLLPFLWLYFSQTFRDLIASISDFSAE